MSTAKFFNNQKKFITKHFGEKAAEYANYGWVADRNAYLTKVYGQKGEFPTSIVTTFLDEDGKIGNQINAY